MRRIVSAWLALLLLAGCSAASPGASDAPGGDGTEPAASVPADDTAADDTAADDTAADDTAAGKFMATFTVTTTGKATVTWGSVDGVQQEEIKKGTWTREADLGEFEVSSLMVVAVDFDKPVTVTCEIVVNGVSKSKDTGTGNSASASCGTDGM